jgi:hypothetical protein
MNAAMKRWVALAALVLVVALGTEPTAVATSTATGSTKVAKVKAVGLSLRYPAGWTVVPTARLTPQALKRLRKSNPKAAEFLSQDVQDQLAKGTKFTAKDLDAQFRGDFADILGVLAAPHEGFPGSLDDFQQLADTIAQKANGHVLLVGSGHHVGGKTAYDLTISVVLTRPDGKTVSARIGQLYVPEGDGFALVNVTVTDDATGQAIIDGILGSVRRT